MKAYAAVVSARFRMLLQYRVAALAGLGTQVFWGLIRMMFFTAFYRSTTAPQPMSLTDVITYIWLGQALLGMLPWIIDREMRAMIRSGMVAYELVRPLDLYAFWFCRDLARRTAPTLLRAAPMFVIAGLFFGLQPPASWASAGAWALATLGALLLGTAIANLLNISMLWTVSGQGISTLMVAAVSIFSGMYVPLPFFPAWARTVLDILPFRGLMDVPFRLYIGHIPPSEILPLFAHQLAWTLGLIVVGRLLLARGIRRLVIQGG